MRRYFLYKITNLITSKIYIGKTYSIKRRWNDHKSTAKNKDKNYSYLHSSMNKYGFENFSIIEIARFESEQEALEQEIVLIQEYKSNDRNIGYNITIGGDGACGYKHTELSKKKMSLKRQGKFIKENNPFYGKTHSNESKLKISEYQKSIQSLNKEKYDSLNKRQCSINTEQCIIIQQYYLTTNYSLEQLAKDFNTTISTISKILHGTYMSIRQNSILSENDFQKIKAIRKIKQSFNAKKFKVEEENNIINDYYHNNISFNEILIKYQCSPPTLNKIINKAQN